MLKAWIRAEKKYLDTHPNCKAKQKFGDAYGLAFHDLFCTSYGDYLAKIAPPLFDEYQLDTKKYLEEYFGIDLTV